MSFVIFAAPMAGAFRASPFGFGRDLMDATCPCVENFVGTKGRFHRHKNLLTCLCLHFFIGMKRVRLCYEN